MLLKCLCYILALKGRKISRRVCDVRIAIYRIRIHPSMWIFLISIIQSNDMHYNKLDIRKLRNKQ